jgi:hypothetical protein
MSQVTYYINSISSVPSSGGSGGGVGGNPTFEVENIDLQNSYAAPVLIGELPSDRCHIKDMIITDGANNEIPPHNVTLYRSDDEVGTNVVNLDLSSQDYDKQFIMAAGINDPLLANAKVVIEYKDLS